MWPGGGNRNNSRSDGENSTIIGVFVVTGLRWPMDILPKVGVAGRFPLDDRGFPYQYLSPTHALHLYSYHAKARIGGLEVDVTPGDLTITPSGVPLSFDMPKPGHHLCIHFAPLTADHERAVTLPPHMSLGPWRDYVSERVLAVVRWQADSPRQPAAGYAASAALQELLLWLGSRPVRSTAMNEGHADRAVEQVLTIIEDTLSEKVRLPALAKRVQLSQNYLARCFRQQVGLTIPRYLLTRRIELAHELLVTTDLPVQRIAERVGLADPQHFNKQFRHMRGMSPSAARAAATGRDAIGEEMSAAELVLR
jgi:AraC-like DNA-binding protein